MRIGSCFVNILAAAAVLGATAGCSSDLATRPSTSSPSTADRAPVTFSLAQASASSGAAASITSILSGDFGGPGGYGDFGDGVGHHWRGWWGWLRPRDVDSLVVTVSKVEVLAALPDSEDAGDSLADSVAAGSAGPRADHDDDEQREYGWVQLDTAGGTHLDLLHLPDSTGPALLVASGALPAGSYRHVRLFLTNPLIYFDSMLVTPAGDSLKPDTGYAVTFPATDSTGAIFKTDDPFVVPAAGDTVQMVFDRDDTVHHIIITGSGTIIVPPSFRFRWWRR